MAQGTITALHSARGYGFIAVDGESAPVYFQQEDIEQGIFTTLRKGQRVEFIITPDPLKTDRMRAEDVRLVE
jgi:cold shock CspA family protein